jgi:hypothetical protein
MAARRTPTSCRFACRGLQQSHRFRSDYTMVSVNTLV